MEIAKLGWIVTIEMVQRALWQGTQFLLD